MLNIRPPSPIQSGTPPAKKPSGSPQKELTIPFGLYFSLALLLRINRHRQRVLLHRGSDITARSVVMEALVRGLAEMEREEQHRG
jgi:hypothetical protein